MSSVVINKNSIGIQAGAMLDMNKVSLPKERPADDGYDPRLHRNPNKPIKSWMAYLNLLRSCFGAGMLAIPQAISHTGIILGPIMTICTGCLVVHGHFTLIWCLNEISRQLKIPYTSFAHGFRIAVEHGPNIFKHFADESEIIISLFMLFSQLGICCVFVIFTSDSLRDIMDWSSSKPAQLCLFLPYMLLEFFMADLKIISFVSMLGNIMNFVAIIIVIYFITQDPHAGEVIYCSTNVVHLIFGFGLMLYNLNAIAVILSLEEALEKPYDLTKRCGILNIGIWVPTIASAVFGPAGYWSFGSMEDNILRSLPYDNILTMVVIGLYLIAITLAFPIQCHPGVQIAVNLCKNHCFTGVNISRLEAKTIDASCRIIFVIICSPRPPLLEMGLPEHISGEFGLHSLRWQDGLERILCQFFNDSTIVVCFFFPVQGPFVAFVGTLCSSILVLVFPSIMELCIKYPGPYGRFKFYLVKNILLILFGLCTSILGGIQCIQLILVRALFLEVNVVEDID